MLPQLILSKGKKVSVRKVNKWFMTNSATGNTLEQKKMLHCAGSVHEIWTDLS